MQKYLTKSISVAVVFFAVALLVSGIVIFCNNYSSYGGSQDVEAASMYIISDETTYRYSSTQTVYGKIYIEVDDTYISGGSVNAPTLNSDIDIVWDRTFTLNLRAGCSWADSDGLSIDMGGYGSNISYEDALNQETFGGIGYSGKSYNRVNNTFTYTFSVNPCTDGVYYKYIVYLMKIKDIGNAISGTPTDISRTINVSYHNDSDIKSGNIGIGSIGTTSGSYTANSSITLVANNVSGYTFDGWYSSSTGTSPLSTNLSYPIIVPNANTTYYAKWTQNTYDLTLDPGGGYLPSENLITQTNLQSDRTGSGNNMTYSYDASSGTWLFTETGSSDPYVSTQLRANLTAGNTYNMHVSISNESGAEDQHTGSIQMFYAINGAYNEANSFRLSTSGTATFVANSTGTYWFRFDDDTTLTKIRLYNVYIYSTTSTSNRTVTLEQGWYYQLPIPIREGYTFTGWSASNSYSSITNNVLCMGSADVTLTAQWSANQYAVTLSQEGGTGGTGQVMATYGSSMPSIAVPSRAGYKFSGYYAGQIGEGTQYYDASGNSTATYTLTTDTTLYAMWLPLSQVVTLDLGGGTLINGTSFSTVYSSNDVFKLPSDITVPVIDVVNLSLEQNATYMLSLVYVANGSIQFDIDLFPDDLPQIALTATTEAQLLNWTIVPTSANASSCRLRFFNDIVKPTTCDTYITNVFLYKVNTVTDSSTIMTMYGGTYGELPTPTRANYDFLGWYLDSNYATPVTADTVVTTSTNHTLYAKWELSDVELTLQTNFNGTNGVSGAGTYKYGDSVTITAGDIDTKFTFVEWQNNGTTFSTDAQCTFQILEDTNLVAVYHFAYDTYYINHVSQLYWLADYVNNGYDFAGVTFTLMNDLDMSEVDDQAWETIGSGDNVFAGTIMGNGYKISNNGNAITMFYNCSGAVIDVTLEGNITAGVEITNNNDGLLDSDVDSVIEPPSVTFGGR